MCASPYTLLGMDEWVRGFRWVSHADCFDGAHPRVFVPRARKSADVFPYETLEEMNATMLAMPDVQAHIRARGPGRLAMLLFDEDAERLARELDLDLIFPHAELRRRVDDKIETTRLGERAGVPSVPNALGRVTSWQDLQQLAGHLGPDLVIQTSFGDSGTTTFFVSSPDDLHACLATVADQPEVRVMLRPGRGRGLRHAGGNHRRTPSTTGSSTSGSSIPGDIGVLVLRGRLMQPDRALTPRASAWNRAIRGEFVSAPL